MGDKDKGGRKKTATKRCNYTGRKDLRPGSTMGNRGVVQKGKKDILTVKITLSNKEDYLTVF